MSRHHSRSAGYAFLRLLWLIGAMAGLWVASQRLAPPADWQSIAPDLSYRRLRITAAAQSGSATLHVLRLDPRRYRVRLVRAGLSQVATAAQLAQRSGALAVINGGFFDETFRPLGLRVSGGQVFRPLRRADWGVFYIRHGKPSIVHTRDYHAAGVSEAVQCGPRLVVNGHITKLRPQLARRSCVGIDAKGRVLLVVSQGQDVDATYLAKVLSAPETAGGLGCYNALNLDGGPSSQLSVAVGRFRLDLPGTWGVPDGLGVFRQ